MRWGENAVRVQISFEQRALIDRLLEASMKRGFYKIRRKTGIVYGPFSGFENTPQKVRIVDGKTLQSRS